MHGNRNSRGNVISIPTGIPWEWELILCFYWEWDWEWERLILCVPEMADHVNMKVNRDTLCGSALAWNAASPSQTVCRLPSSDVYRERKCADTIGTALVPWAFLMLKYIFEIKYTEAILSNSTWKLLRFEITMMLIAVKKINALCHLLQLSAHFRSLFWLPSVLDRCVDAYSSSRSKKANVHTY